MLPGFLLMFALLLAALFAFSTKMIILAVIAAAALWGIAHSMLFTN